MANVAMLSTHVTGGVAGESILEGRAVVMSASGLHGDLPTALLATANATNVFVAFVPPDQFPRPTPVGMFTSPQSVTFSQFGMNLADLTTHELVYRIGPSNLEAPVAASGWLVQLHKGGAYNLTAGCYTDSDDIRKNGALIKVGASGIFEYADAGTYAVGYVREYRNGRLVIVLDQKVS
jgi:hypothetical protein